MPFWKPKKKKKAVHKAKPAKSLPKYRREELPDAFYCFDRV